MRDSAPDEERAAAPRFIFISTTQINLSLAAAVNFIEALKAKCGGGQAF